MKYFNPSYIDFFQQLEKNNSKEWFHQYKEIYSLAVDNPFRKFIDDLLVAIRKEDNSILIESKDAIFRINKDMRFAKDKKPYKLHRSALISTVGRKSKEVPGFYIELSVNDVKIGGGCYKLSPSKIQKIECDITLLNLNEEFKSSYGDINFNIQNKYFTYETNLPSDSIFQNDFLKSVLNYWRIGQPVNQFLTSI